METLVREPLPEQPMPPLVDRAHSSLAKETDELILRVDDVAGLQTISIVVPVGNDGIRKPGNRNDQTKEFDTEFVLPMASMRDDQISCTARRRGLYQTPERRRDSRGPPVPITAADDSEEDTAAKMMVSANGSWGGARCFEAAQATGCVGDVCVVTRPIRTFRCRRPSSFLFDRSRTAIDTSVVEFLSSPTGTRQIVLQDIRVSGEGPSDEGHGYVCRRNPSSRVPASGRRSFLAAHWRSLSGHRDECREGSSRRHRGGDGTERGRWAPRDVHVRRSTGASTRRGEDTRLGEVPKCGQRHFSGKGKHGCRRYTAQRAAANSRNSVTRASGPPRRSETTCFHCTRQDGVVRECTSEWVLRVRCKKTKMV